VIDAVIHWAPWCLAAYVAVALLWPVLRWPASRRVPSLFLVALGLLALPLVVSAERTVSRAIVAVFAATFVIKLYDLHRGAARGSVPSWPAYLLFMLNPFGHVYRRLATAPVPTVRQNLMRLGRGIVLAAVGAAGFSVARATHPAPFFLEHALKVTFGFVIVYGAAEIVFAVWSTLGLRGIPQFENYFLARTPAEFWRRYNRPVTQYMFENVFRPAGGARAPVRATLAAFFFSGVLHEYIADIALGDVQGFQLAFFMLHGVAVAVTRRLRPRGRTAAVVGIAATILFNLTASLLFCASAARMFDLYSAAAPDWMHAR
jgi:hypothetical protein